MDRKCLAEDYKLKQPLQYSQRFGKNICDCLDLTKKRFSKRVSVSISDCKIFLLQDAAFLPAWY